MWALSCRAIRAPKFIVTDDVERTADRVLDALEGADVVRLNGEDTLALGAHFASI